MSTELTNPIVPFLQLDQIGRALSDIVSLAWLTNPEGRLASFKPAVDLLRAITAGALLKLSEDRQLGLRADALGFLARDCSPTVALGLLAKLRALPELDVLQMFDALELRLCAEGCSKGSVAKLKLEALSRVFSENQPSPSSAEPDKSSAPPAVADGDT